MIISRSACCEASRVSFDGGNESCAVTSARPWTSTQPRVITATTRFLGPPATFRVADPIRDEELIPENLDSLDRLVRFIERKRQMAA